MRAPIDYAEIDRAITFYSKKGYKYIEVPWIVPNTTTWQV